VNEFGRSKNRTVTGETVQVRADTLIANSLVYRARWIVKPHSSVADFFECSR